MYQHIQYIKTVHFSFDKGWFDFAVANLQTIRHCRKYFESVKITYYYFLHSLQFAAFKAAYRKHSTKWHPTLKRFEEGNNCVVGREHTRDSKLCNLYFLLVLASIDACP